MFKYIGKFVLSTTVLTTCGAITLGQANLTTKANMLSPSPSVAVVETDRTRDGLVGPARRVRTEVAKLSNQNGKLIEGKHAVLEVVEYDVKGNKIENQYFPIAGANLTGKEVYKYDAKGNISEMTRVNDDGSLLSKEIYKYEFDFAGNWNRMTTSVAVVEAGRTSFEPTEVTYRSIMYYLDENMLRMAQPSISPASGSHAVTNLASTNPESKSLPSKSSVENNTGPNKKSSPSLPAPMITSDKLNALGPVEVANARPHSSVQAPVVHLDSEAPPPPAPNRSLKPVSGGVLNGTAQSLPPPGYPDGAKRLRISGVVSVEVMLDESGKVISAKATSGPILLRESAVQAALKARFSPTRLSGQPVKVSGMIIYKFALTK